MVTLFGLALALVPTGTLTLECQLSDAAVSPAESGIGHGTRLTLRIVGEGGSVTSAEVEGHPFFSSSQGLTVYTARPTRSGRLDMSSSSPSRDALRWQPQSASETVELRRGESRISLAPIEGGGGYSGRWSLAPVRMGGSFTTAASSGRMLCQTADTER